MNVMLTGASGFIGAHVARILQKRQHHLSIIALPDDRLTRLQGIRDSIEVYRVPLEDIDSVRKVIEYSKPEACIHLAWYAEPGQYLFSPQNIAALNSSLSLFEALTAVGCKRIVGAGTCLEYDTNFGYLREETPVRPTSLYAAAKLSCGLVGARIVCTSETTFAWGRIFYPYGPQEDPRRLVPSAIASLSQGRAFEATPGEQIRDYIHVADVASAFCVLAESQDRGVFNISSGVPISVRQLLEVLGGLLKRSDLLSFGSLSYRADDPQFVCGCNDRLKALGWHPLISLAEGLADTIRAEEIALR